MNQYINDDDEYAFLNELETTYDERVVQEIREDCDFEALLQSFSDSSEALLNFKHEPSVPQTSLAIENDIIEINDEQLSDELMNLMPLPSPSPKKRRRYNEDYDDDVDYVSNEDNQHSDSNESMSTLSGNKSSSQMKRPNKQAASKYRLKKLTEKDKLFEARDYLEKRNDEVKREIDIVKTEVDYLKNFLVQMLMFKGIMSPTGKIINS